jgi:hypothetical protein
MLQGEAGRGRMSQLPAPDSSRALPWMACRLHTGRWWVVRSGMRPVGEGTLE